jgi:ADP-ribose pyrophosphatase YjhB (NUDIX family)
MKTVELAGCVVTHESGILLIHRNTPELVQWEVPGGKQQANETLAEAAGREFEEELGAKPVVGEELGIGYFCENTQPHRYTWFGAELAEGATLQVMEPAKHDGWEYFHLHRLRRREDVSASVRLLIKRIVDGEIKLDI